MGQPDTLSDLRRFGVYPRGHSHVWIGPGVHLPVVHGSRYRPCDRLEGLGGDVVMGEHTEDTSGYSGHERAATPLRITDGRRVYAVANITRGTITFLCARNVADAYRRVKTSDTDVLWHSTRINPGVTHVHDGQGHCIPKQYLLRDSGAYLAR